MTQTVNQLSLYDRDFNLWLEETASRLKAGDFGNLDINNLLEEIEGLGRAEKNKVRGFLDVLLIHLLKRCYVVMPECYRGWENEIDEYRRQLEILLDASHSLRPYLESIFDNSFKYALRRVRKDYSNIKFPSTWQFSSDIDAILTEEFWQGLT